MPFKDDITQRLYQKEWVWKKRHGITTRTKIYPADYLSWQALKRHKSLIKKAAYNRKKTYIDGAIGTKCILCGEDADDIHRLDRTKHKFFQKTSWTKIDSILGKDRFKYIPLCKKCHKLIHIYMD